MNSEIITHVIAPVDGMFEEFYKNCPIDQLDKESYIVINVISISELTFEDKKQLCVIGYTQHNRLPVVLSFEEIKIFKTKIIHGYKNGGSKRSGRANNS